MHIGYLKKEEWSRKRKFYLVKFQLFGIIIPIGKSIKGVLWESILVQMASVEKQM